MKCRYVLVEGEDDIKCNSFEDVVRALVDEKYYDMSENEKKEALKRKAAANTFNRGILTTEKDLSDFDLEDEVTYVLSLLNQKSVYLLESAENRELTKDIDLPDDAKNYVVVNNFANEILDSYKKGKKDKETSREDR